MGILKTGPVNSHLRRPGRSRPSKRWPLGDRSGQVMALFAVAAVPLLAMLALAVDVGLLLTARDEAQRAADSGALAGAAEFRGCKATDCVTRSDAAEAMAKAYATKNSIRKQPITDEEVTVQVMPDERKVRVFVNRDGVPTFFAHLLGVPVAPIGAVAAAMVSTGGVGQCLMPFWGPDLWREWGDTIPGVGEADDWHWGDDGESEPGAGDGGEDLTPDPGDESPPAAPRDCTIGHDCYQPFQLNGPEGNNGTGYGSSLRDPDPIDPYVGDYGREIIIQSEPRGSNKDETALGEMVAPGNFQLWRVPLPTFEDGEWNCDEPELATGTNDLVSLIEGDIPCSCQVSLNEDLQFEAEPKTGGAWTPIANAIQQRIDNDPIHAQWSDTQPNGGELICDGGKSGSQCYGSSRVVTIAIANPTQVVDLTGASVGINFNNFARLYLESVENPQGGGDRIVRGRFLGFAPGGAGPVTGDLVEHLRLVE